MAVFVVALVVVVVAGVSFVVLFFLKIILVFHSTELDVVVDFDGPAQCRWCRAGAAAATGAVALLLLLLLLLLHHPLLLLLLPPSLRQPFLFRFVPGRWPAPCCSFFFVGSFGVLFFFLPIFAFVFQTIR